VLQNARKQAGLEVADRILVRWSSGDPEVREALAEHASTVAREVLAAQFAEGTTGEVCRINEHDVGYGIEKA
jgi:isoleucyl-tRNA synthetase